MPRPTNAKKGDIVYHMYGQRMVVEEVLKSGNNPYPGLKVVWFDPFGQVQRAVLPSILFNTEKWP